VDEAAGAVGAGVSKTVTGVPCVGGDPIGSILRALVAAGAGATGVGETDGDELAAPGHVWLMSRNAPSARFRQKMVSPGTMLRVAP